MGGENPAADYPELARAALVDRRMAMRLMAASAALAAAGGCSRDEDGRERYAGQGDVPLGVVPSTLAQQGLGLGVLVRTAGGNPIKVEGHPDHPATLGRSNVAMQAAVLSHYDPDRLRQPSLDGRSADWDAVRALLTAMRGELRVDQGAGTHILVEPQASPTLERMLALVRAAYPRIGIHARRPAALEPRPLPDLDGDLIVSLGEDFLGHGPAQILNAERFMAARRAGLAGGDLPRLVVVEPIPTLTGARADLRIARDAAGMARSVAAALRGGTADADALRIAALIRAAERPSILFGAGVARPPEFGPAADAPAIRAFDRASVSGIESLAEAIDTGAVRRLLILGGNPAFDLPRALRFGERLGRVRERFYLGDWRDETAALATGLLPAPGAFEGWGDLRAVDGTTSLVRPATENAGISPIELLAMLVGERPDGRALVAATHGIEPEAFDTLTGGILLPGTAPVADLPAALPPSPVERGVMPALHLHAHPHLSDDQLANNGWIHELPDPITGLAWGNAATLSLTTAERLGVEQGELIEIAARDATAVLPALLLPGQADDVIGVATGYGRRAGAIAGGLGVDVRPFGESGEVVPITHVRPLGRRGRLIFPNAPFRPSAPDAVRVVAPGEQVARADPGPSFTEPSAEATKQWGMVIDLDACIGCNACTIACQAENNVPVVGPDEVAAGRVMHWLRVDRHPGTDGAPAAYQPIPCMHCETAPCEPVCPVGATTHSSEGINQMTYQRCIGTRSCSNNCPYKVRRFNWFDYQAEPGAMPDQGHNPRVTVRDRGVMEKCTYCVQRIEAVRTGDEAGPPRTACQQACPTQAIRFGDISDPADPVSEARASERNYALLDGLNLMPRTTYLARVVPERDNG